MVKNLFPLNQPLGKVPQILIKSFNSQARSVSFKKRLLNSFIQPPTSFTPHSPILFLDYTISQILIIIVAKAGRVGCICIVHRPQRVAQNRGSNHTMAPNVPFEPELVFSPNRSRRRNTTLGSLFGHENDRVAHIQMFGHAFTTAILPTEETRCLISQL